MKASTAYRDQVLREALLTEGRFVAADISEQLKCADDTESEADFLKLLEPVAPLIEKLQEIERMLRGYAAEKR